MITQLDNQYLLDITADLPMKQIDVDDQPYLQRYYAGQLTRGFSAGHDIWLHRFMSEDADRHLHNHPFNARSYVLLGGYTETVLRDPKSKQSMIDMLRRQGSINRYMLHNLIREPDLHMLWESFEDDRSYAEALRIDPFRWHRISHVEPATWTLMIVDPRRLPFWYFAETGGRISTILASPRDWWRDCGTRKTEGLE